MIKNSLCSFEKWLFIIGILTRAFKIDWTFEGNHNPLKCFPIFKQVFGNYYCWFAWKLEPAPNNLGQGCIISRYHTDVVICYHRALDSPDHIVGTESFIVIVHTVLSTIHELALGLYYRRSMTFFNFDI